MRRQLTPKQFFVAAALLLGCSVAAVTSVSQAAFFQQAIIERESRIIDDVVDAAALGSSQISRNGTDYRDTDIRRELARRFAILRDLPGVVLIKVFAPDQSIIWSSDPALIGTKQTKHPTSLRRAFLGDVGIEFDRVEQVVHAILHPTTAEPLIEFYVPVYWTFEDLDNPPADAVVALYRSPKELNRTIFRGLLWLWLVTTIGGAILLFAIFSLYRAVYNRQRKVEREFAKLTEQQAGVIQMEKLSAVGRLVTEIAHQLNNPLVGVVNLAALAEREADNPDRVRALLRDVQNAGTLCRDFVQGMLQLNAAPKLKPQATDMAQLVSETVAFFRQSFGKGPEIRIELSPSCPILQVDPVLIRHALFNLVHNAALAAPQGTVTVGMAPSVNAGVDGFSISVSDTGKGIDKSVADKLFTPFFTTRTGGTGLGLLVAQQIALRHGGTLTAKNRDEGGALFTIWLPSR